ICHSYSSYLVTTTSRPRCCMQRSAMRNVLALAAVGDFEAFYCQLSTNLDRSTALQLTTLAPLRQTAVSGSLFFSRSCYFVQNQFRYFLSSLQEVRIVVLFIF